MKQRKTKAELLKGAISESERRRIEAQVPDDDEVCPDCGHSLKDNRHGPDQNDYVMAENGSYHHSGHCTYCKECQQGHK